jgi:hypothetical protein
MQMLQVVKKFVNSVKDFWMLGKPSYQPMWLYIVGTLLVPFSAVFLVKDVASLIQAYLNDASAAEIGFHRATTFLMVISSVIVTQTWYLFIDGARDERKRKVKQSPNPLMDYMQ